MFSSEIKETIYVAIGCMLAAMVLGLVAYVLDIRSDLASVQNTENAAKYNMSAYMSYNKYQGSILYGEDVIAVIREYAGTDVIVYIDKLTDEKNVEHDYYLDKQEYINNPSIASINGLEYGTGNTISGGVKRNTTYFSYLVFSEYTKEDIKKYKYSEDGVGAYYSEVTAVVIKKVGDGRHKPALTQADCGCDGKVNIYGTCTAVTIYNNVNALKVK